MFAVGITIFMVSYLLFHNVELNESVEKKKNMIASVSAGIGILLMTMSIIKLTWDYLP